ncbi:hypothetical protein [Geothrix mesophila]|uniref:hypothetical protein n=1 Tax=Geothrix mesophila TaxID=2922723 RepID=UPI001FACBD42|nr:hypothetical protein [Geothrix sp. SG198]
MGFFDRFRSRADEAPLPSLATLLETRGLPASLPGLEALVPTFEAHRRAEEREAWADAVAETHRLGLPLPEPWIDAQDHLLPELVPTWRAEREGRWSHAFIDGLTARIRVAEVVMPAAWLRIWDQPAEDVLDLALDHLRHRSEGAFVRLPSGIYQAPWHDGADAARLLLPEVWHGLFKDQHPFLAIPTADTLLAAPQILLPKLMEEVGRALQAKGQAGSQTGAQPLQLAVLERIGDKLVTARLQEPHPMSAPQRELKNMDFLEALRNQEKDLDPGLGRPAPVLLLKTGQGKPLTMATWTDGAPTLLPEADLIGFAGPDGEPLGIYWRQSLPRMHEVRGTAVDIWGPRRVRYEGFPTAEQIARLEPFATAEQMKSLQAQPGVQPGSRPSAPKAVAPAGAPFSAQGAAPLPKHLRGAGLGVQDKD